MSASDTGITGTMASLNINEKSQATTAPAAEATNTVSGARDKVMNRHRRHFLQKEHNVLKTDSTLASDPLEKQDPSNSEVLEKVNELTSKGEGAELTQQQLHQRLIEENGKWDLSMSVRPFRWCGEIVDFDRPWSSASRRFCIRRSLKARLLQSRDLL
jgi:hypothetical protein